MKLQRLARAMVFLAGSIVGGLALAFVIVFVHPQLLQRPAVPIAVAQPSRTDGASSTAALAPTPPLAPAPAPAPAPHPGLGDAAQPPADAAGTAGPLFPNESFAAAVKRAAPAVVNISTARLVTEQVQPSAFDQLFGDLLPSYRRRWEHALGSGVIVDAGGHVLTNNHVIANADQIIVTLADGRTSIANIVGRDPDTDLALLSIKLNGLPVMPLGRSDELQIGDAVLAIGYPLGLSQTVTHGIVSATGRNQLGVATFENFIQTDAAINAGNSGGALIDARGELIGINTAVLNKTYGSDMSVEGIGFAIPVNLARGVMLEILDHGRVIRGWIGILPEDITDEQAPQLGLPRGGVVITNMYRNSPAVAASLHIGDIVMALDGQAVRNAHDTLSQIAAKKPGSSLTLRLLRGSNVVQASVRVTERPISIQGT
jgi:serine protease DegS